MGNQIPVGVEETGRFKCYLFKDSKTGAEDSLCVLASEKGEDPNTQCSTVNGEVTCLNDNGMQITCAVPDGDRDACYEKHDIPELYRR